MEMSRIVIPDDIIIIDKLIILRILTRMHPVLLLQVMTGVILPVHIIIIIGVNVVIETVEKERVDGNPNDVVVVLVVGVELIRIVLYPHLLLLLLLLVARVKDVEANDPVVNHHLIPRNDLRISCKI
jgi:hypothetical protein